MTTPRKAKLSVSPRNEIPSLNAEHPMNRKPKRCGGEDCQFNALLAERDELRAEVERLKAEMNAALTVAGEAEKNCERLIDALADHEKGVGKGERNAF